jgi:hypothetical protein
MSSQPAATEAIHRPHPVDIVVNRRPVVLPSPQDTGAEILKAAGFEGEKWDLFRLHGEHDPTGGTLVLAAETITVHEGEHFRVIPGERTFG